MQKTVLDNGVTVVTRRFSELATSYFHWRVVGGSSAEPPGSYGGTHYLEHVLSDRERLLGVIEKRGEDLNAYTSKIAMDMYAHVWPHHGEKALREILIKGFKEPRFSPKTYQAEGGRIRGEIVEAHQETTAILYDESQLMIYRDGPRAHSIIGTADEFNQLSLPKLKALHASMLNGKKLIISAAGDVHHDEVVAQVNTLVGDLPAGEVFIPAPSRFHPGGLGIAREGLAGVELLLNYATPPASRQQRAAIILFGHMLAVDSQAYLMKHLSFQSGLAYSVGVHTEDYPDGGLLTVSATIAEKHAQKALSSIANLMMQYPERMTAAEFRRVKKIFEFKLASTLETPEDWGQRAMNDMQRFGYVRSLAELREEYSALTLDQVRKAARQITAQPPFTAALGEVDNLQINEPFEEAFEKFGGRRAQRWLKMADAQRDSLARDSLAFVPK